VTERDGTPVPGLTVPDVTRQLTWRVLGPLKGRAKSVLDWSGLRGEPPQTFQEAGTTYFVTGRTVAHRVRRVAAEGARLPLSQELIAELTRPTAPDEDPIMRRRCSPTCSASTRTAPPVTADAHVADPPAAHIDSSPDARPDPPTPPE